MIAVKLARICCGEPTCADPIGATWPAMPGSSAAIWSADPWLAVAISFLTKLRY
jgi:hypothetical protein